MHGAIEYATGKLLQVSLEQLQLGVGMGTPVMKVEFEKWGFLATDC